MINENFKDFIFFDVNISTRKMKLLNDIDSSPHTRNELFSSFFIMLNLCVYAGIIDLLILRRIYDYIKNITFRT